MKNLIPFASGFGGERLDTGVMHFVHRLGGRSGRDGRRVGSHRPTTMVRIGIAYSLSRGFIDRAGGESSAGEGGDRRISQKVPARTLLTE